MKNLVFKELLLISDQLKQARRITFTDRYNLILAINKNSVGKSTIVKNLFWGLGCDPRFDAKWKDIGCKSLVSFSVGKNSYRVARDGNRFFVSENQGEFELYTGVTGEFAERFSGIVGFHAKLPVRGKEEVETPPPAFYFLPYYIDQKVGWSSAWSSFDGLQQYSSWQNEIIPYHIGVTDKDYFSITEELYSVKRDISSLKKEIDRVDSAIGVVNQFVPDIETTLSLDEFDDIQVELKNDILNLHNEQEVLFEEISNLKSDLGSYENQLQIAENAVSELKKDYELAKELEDEILCPTCGVVHDNSLINRFSLLEDQDQAEQVVKRLNKSVNAITKDLKQKNSDLERVRKNIERLNKKYYREEKNQIVSLQNILDSVAAHSVKNKVEHYRDDIRGDLYRKEGDAQALDKDRSDRASSRRKVIYKKFQEIFPAFTAKTRVFGIAASDIKSPEHYKKIANSGGAAESVRGMLSYYVSVYNLIVEFGEETVAPFVLDTPNQHEQSVAHYDKIVQLISENLPESTQIIMCGMDSPNLSSIKKSANIIYLEDEYALLTEGEYKQSSEEVSEIFGMVSDD